MDVRVLAATNKDLEDEIEKGNFRADLFWRLNVVPIVVPPLRDRLEDIPLFVEAFTEEYSTKGLGNKSFTAGALKALGRHNWPGNVRELRNFLERLFIMTPEEEISEDMIKSNLAPSVENVGLSTSGIGWSLFMNMPFKEAKKAFEREFLKARLDENDGNISQTAEQIGIERSHLHKKMKTF